MKNHKVIWAFWVVVPFFSFSINLWADEGSLARLAGPAFVQGEANPALVSSAWMKKGVVYPAEIGQADLVLSLDQHLYPAITPMIETFGRERGVKIVVREGTCGVSAGMLVKKAVDSVGFCCPPAPTDRLPGVVFHTIGVVANVLIVHPDNPTTNVSIQEARAMFAGENDRWNALNDAAAKAYAYSVHPITRMHCKLRPGHWRYLLDKEDAFSMKLHNVSSIPDMLSQVSVDPGGVGWVAHWLLSDAANRDRVKVLRINGVSPEDPSALAEGRYRFYKVLNMTSWSGAAANPLTETLIHYLLAHLKDIPSAARIVGVDRLRAAGWQFRDRELVGEPAP